MKLYASEVAESHLSSLEWALALRLAGQYQWQPAGTGPPRHAGGAETTPEEDWNGSYVNPVCQRMHPEDCDGLADALEKGLLEAMFKQEIYLDHEARDAWSSLIGFLRTAASQQGLFLVGPVSGQYDESPAEEAPEDDAPQEED